MYIKSTEKDKRIYMIHQANYLKPAVILPAVSGAIPRHDYPNNKAKKPWETGKADACSVPRACLSPVA